MSKRKPAAAKTHSKLIQARLRKRDYLIHIAADLGVSHPAISQVLAQTYHYKRSRRIGAEKRLTHVGERGYEPLKWQIRRYEQSFGKVPDHIMAQIAKPMMQRNIPKQRKPKQR